MATDTSQACIDACNTCADACDRCATACLQEHDIAMMARCIRLDMDCTAICRLAAGWIARGSDFAQPLCRLCAQVCQACADECGRHTHGHCQRCAEACRACAAACQAMVA